MRRSPSCENGIVAKERTVAPHSAARPATTAAAPLPVPPPSPVTSTTTGTPANRRRRAASSDSAEARPRAASPPVPIPRVCARPSCKVAAPAGKERASVSSNATATSDGSCADRRVTIEQPAPPRPTSRMEAGEDILEAEEFFELVEEAAGTTHQRWRIGNRSGH